MKKGLWKAAGTFSWLLAAVVVRAGGLPLEEERLTVVESPAVMGQGKFSFDFQHLWTDGKSLPNERMPVAELGVRVGVLPALDVRVSGLFNNSDVVVGADRGFKHFALFEYEAHYRFVNQAAGAPVTVAAAVAYAKWNLSSGVNNNVIFFDGQVYGGKLILQRDFPRLGQYAVYKWAHTKIIQGGRTYVVSVVQLGERIKIIRRRKLAVDALAEWGPVLSNTKNFGGQPRNAWSMGLQFQAYNPHTITLFVTNVDSMTLADSVFGQKGSAYGFRWSYRY